MSTTTTISRTATSTPARPSRGARRAMPAGLLAMLRRATQRRRYVAAERADDREERTDAYIDHHGTAALAALIAFNQR